MFDSVIIRRFLVNSHGEPLRSEAVEGLLNVSIGAPSSTLASHWIQTSMLDEEDRIQPVRFVKLTHTNKEDVVLVTRGGLLVSHVGEESVFAGYV